MIKKWLVYVDGVLWDRKLTRIRAEEVVNTLQKRGLKAVIAYKNPNEAIE